MEQAEVIQRHLERITTQVYPESAHASRAVAERIAALIRERASAGKHAVLGLATGSTPVGVYEHLVRLHKEGLSFRNVVTFNLDEYWPMDPASIHSYSRFMREHLFDHIDIPRASIHIPDGTAERENVARACAAYEEAIRDAGGIDLQLLGIGRTGHVGFNEPGSSRESRTRLITLDRVTRMDAAGDFFGERHVPRQAITMGVGSIMDAREVVLMAFGEHKAGIVRRAVEEPVSAIVAASYLQQHAIARFVLDAAAAAELTRIKTPWLLGSLADLGREWDTAITRKAVLWLATTVKKPILKLTNEDYNEHHLQDLLATRGGSKGAYEINLEVFRAMQRTITGWPAGKPRDGAAGFTDTPRDHRVPAAGPSAGGGGDGGFPKRVIVFSPHPDDDVISMGGTLIRLCEQGHEVHVAYQTSGNIAVWDEYALRHVDFVRELAALVPGLGADAAATLERDVSAFIAHKAAGEMDTATLQAIKALIRRTEARAGARPRESAMSQHPLPRSAVLRDRSGQEEAARRTGLRDHEESPRKCPPAPGLRGGRPVRPARHAPRVPRERAGEFPAIEGRAVDGGLHALALPGRLAGVGAARDRDGRAAVTGRSPAQARGDLQAREPEGHRALPRPQRHPRVLATGRGPQPRDRTPVRRAGARGV